MLKLLRTIAITALIFLSAQGWAQSTGADWDALNSEAISLYQKNQYEQAVVVATRALDLAERNDGTEYSDLVASLSLLALLYKNQGRYALAEPLVQRSLAIDEKALGPPAEGLCSTTDI